MPTYSSPGNYVIENDFSEYAPAVNSSIAGIVGFASKGPANKATLITSASQLLRTFGDTNQTNGGQGLLAALEILSKTNAVYYVRAENGNLAADASVGINFGSCPAVNVSGIVMSSSISFSFSSTDQDGTSNTTDGDGYILTVADTGTTDPAAAVLTSMAAIETNDWPWTAVSGTDSSSVYFVNNHAGKDARLTVSSTLQDGLHSIDASSGNITTGVGATFATASGTTALAEYSGGSYLVESLYTGAGYNASTITTVNGVSNKGLKVEVKSTTGKTFSVNVINNGTTAEGYQVNMTKDGAITLFPEDVINIGETNPVSEFIKASFKSNTTAVGKGWTPATTWDGKLTTGVSATQADNTITTGLATPRFMKMIDGTYSLAGGNNGDAAGATGLVTGDVKSALIGTTTLKSGIYALDDDSLNISMACVPGITQQDVQNTLITLAESSQNFLAVVAPPEGIPTAQAAVNWHNGQYTGRTAAITSSYAAVYWPWLKQFDPATSTDIFLDPAAYAISMMCFTDSVSDPWFAPAGLVRGRLTKPTDIEVILNQGDRDSLYQPGNAINPIAKFAQDGICIWGQRTAQRTPSSLDRINVRRMMIVIRKMLLASTRSIIFEPNDPMTWNRVVNLVQPAMDDIRRRRGITQFRVICDETTNTPLRVDRNELWCRVLIKPTKTAEVLVFELNLTNQSAQLGV
tara:strand:- start:1824 stop:3896 length:2073 start_codon:yes stop_codon:yes gene_type:complete